MIKLRISDEDFNDALHDYARDKCSVDAVRETIESAGIEAPAVTVEELAEVIRDASMQADSYNDFAPACRCGKCTACAAREVKP